MSTHKHIDKICIAAIIISLILTVLFMNGESLGLQTASRGMGYENRLFDTTQVHTIDIVMDDWDSFIETCENEEYTACAVVIDGEAYRNVGIRAKGNTSLSTVSAMNSQRYSFKIEFDHYDSTTSYYGLDKLCLNNMIQDTTYMKDYLTYRLMGKFGVDAPLCSYVYITVNGEEWGLYLAVEGVEEAFLQRNYGSDYGELYKPDSADMGGGPGNGQDFRMDDFMDAARPEEADGAGEFTRPEEADRTEEFSEQENINGIQDFVRSDAIKNDGGFDSMSQGMGSSDVKLQYIDDDPASYSNIFDNAKTDATDADQVRLIESLKALSSGENIEEVVNVEEVIRYFVVHNFVCNGDSYTGSIIHNYYLYEEDGQLSMIPWDYNLAFGTFQSADATSMVNDPIDTPLSVTDASDRPMWGWIMDSEEYTALYHQYFAEFLDTVDVEAIIDEAYALIASYVEKDPTAFYGYEEFETGVAVLREFCQLRTQSVAGQLDGTIPSTSEGQSADSSALVDASHLTLSDMGSMSTGGEGGMEQGSRRDDRQEEGMWGDRSNNMENGSSAASLSWEESPGGSMDEEAPQQSGGIMDGETSQQPEERADGETSQQPEGSVDGETPQLPGGSADGEMPGQLGGRMSGGDAGDTAPAMEEAGSAVSLSSGPVLLSVSLAVLAVGLVIAFRFKR